MDGMPGNVTFTLTPVGSSQYDACPAPSDPPPEGPQAFLPHRLPVHIAHNLYLNGAAPYVKEEGATVCADSGIEVDIVDRAAGKVVVRVNHPAQLNTGLCEVVTTDTLGMAYHAEMKYEQPDGSPLRFDRDYFGNERKAVIPGPFEVLEKGEIVIAY
jgi:hypothetical protein